MRLQSATASSLPQAHGAGSGPARTAAFEPSTVHLWPRDSSCRFQSSGFWFWQALATGTACASLRLIHHHQRAAALAHLASRTPPRPGAAPRVSCLYRRQKWEIEQTTTAALFLFNKKITTQGCAAQDRPPSPGRTTSMPLRARAISAVDIAPLWFRSQPRD